MVNREEIEDARSKAKNAADKALFFAPFKGSLFYTSSLFAKSSDNKQKLLKKAIHRDPLNGIFLQAAGRFYTEQGDEELGEKLISSGVKYGISRPRRLRYYGVWLLKRGRKDDAVQQIRQAIALDSRNLEKYISIFPDYGYSWQDASSAIPDKSDVCWRFARFLTKQNEMALAEEYYLKSLKPLHEQDTIKPYYFTTVYWFFIKQKKYEKALSILSQGIAQFPDNIKLRMLGADRCRKMGFQARAVEFYKEVLRIDPGHRNARKFLALLQ